MNRPYSKKQDEIYNEIFGLQLDNGKEWNEALEYAANAVKLWTRDEMQAKANEALNKLREAKRLLNELAEIGCAAAIEGTVPKQVKKIYQAIDGPVEGDLLNLIAWDIKQA